MERASMQRHLLKIDLLLMTPCISMLYPVLRNILPRAMKKYKDPTIRTVMSAASQKSTFLSFTSIYFRVTPLTSINLAPTISIM